VYSEAVYVYSEAVYVLVLETNLLLLFRFD